ncbi:MULTISPECIES: DUF3348 family protein [Ramlibacter]|uniref:DUF3348 family protein n=1 Tax=Ramlibacter pinisoli TaxID=2682844 RepID=A0A6N8IQI7_9BURK|nr:MULTISPECIES: DUF3348 family protein [Ramlibacter]MBA2963849.1 DUF3348 family protein [Ramlibacter sp. CGMCC 1.13660]MVQ28815.1 DUF3348 family protein [Ramlibacter pinisoli]
MQSTFSSSRLVRLLGEWTPVDTEPPGMDVAERLGLWLNAFDAIGLQAAHQSIRAIEAATPRERAGAAGPAAGTLAGDLQKLRATLAQAVAQPVEDDGTLAPYQQRHQKLQRDMEQLIPPFRDHARQVLGRASPRLRQLAALDAVLERALAAREQKVLPSVGTHLQRRFQHLRRTQPQDAEPGAWLDTFRQDWRQALLAELDVRLEPVAGLVDALNNPSKHPE